MEPCENDLCTPPNIKQLSGVDQESDNWLPQSAPSACVVLGKPSRPSETQFPLCKLEVKSPAISTSQHGGE